jgi:hypothetical protein
MRDTVSAMSRVIVVLLIAPGRTRRPGSVCNWCGREALPDASSTARISAIAAEREPWLHQPGVLERLLTTGDKISRGPSSLETIGLRVVR